MNNTVVGRKTPVAPNAFFLAKHRDPNFKTKLSEFQVATKCYAEHSSSKQPTPNGDFPRKSHFTFIVIEGRDILKNDPVSESAAHSELRANFA